MENRYFFVALLACTFFHETSRAQHDGSHFAGFYRGMKRAQDFAKARLKGGLECPNPFTAPAKPSEPETLVIKKTDSLYKLLLTTPFNKKNAELGIDTDELNYPSFPAHFKVTLKSYQELFTPNLDDTKRNNLLKKLSQEPIKNLIHLFNFFDFNEQDNLRTFMIQPIVDYYQKNSARYGNSFDTFLDAYGIAQNQAYLMRTQAPVFLDENKTTEIEDVGYHAVINADGSHIAYLVLSPTHEKIEVAGNAKKFIAYQLEKKTGKSIKAFTFNSENLVVAITASELLPAKELDPAIYKAYEVIKIDLSSKKSEKIYSSDAIIGTIGLSHSGNLLGVCSTNDAHSDDYTFFVIDLKTKNILHQTPTKWCEAMQFSSLENLCVIWRNTEIPTPYPHQIRPELQIISLDNNKLIKKVAISWVEKCMISNDGTKIALVDYETSSIETLSDKSFYLNLSKTTGDPHAQKPKDIYREHASIISNGDQIAFNPIDSDKFLVFYPNNHGVLFWDVRKDSMQATVTSNPKSGGGIETLLTQGQNIRIKCEKEEKKSQICSLVGVWEPYLQGNPQVIRKRSAKFFFPPAALVTDPERPFAFRIGQDKRSVEHWSLANGKKVATYQFDFNKANISRSKEWQVQSLDLSKNGNMLMIAGHDTKTQKKSLTLVPIKK